MEEREAQLAWERRFARPAAAAAITSLALGVAAQVLSASATTQRGLGDRVALRDLHDHAGSQIGAAIVQSLSIIFLGLVLAYLLRCLRHRRPEGVPRVLAVLLVAAPLLYAVGNVLSVLDVIDIADRFVGSGAQTEARADALIEDQQPVGAALSFGGRIALGFCLVMVNLHCMRVGLMTRFLGIIGIVVGALYVLPIFAGPLILQVFWLGALVAIFVDRWPGRGRGESWETGEPGIWLSASELRRQQMRQEREGDAPPEMLQPSEPEDLDARPHPVSKKRRRKRNR